jgi:pimeloyl-ACP methyl ester carboxylesterase
MSSLVTRLKITLGTANADEDALIAMRSNADVCITPGKDLSFAPVKGIPNTGVILYPGGRCDPRAYAPILRNLALAGYLIVVPNMPLRMAVLNANRADKIIKAYPEIKSWVIGGHSMGGVMATAYACKHPQSIEGLFLLGSYPASMHAIPERSLPVMMISGSKDSITRESEVTAAPERLPAKTEFITIEGGDHYQFGSFENAEVTATIPRHKQQQQVRDALLEFLGKLEN